VASLNAKTPWWRAIRVDRRITAVSKLVLDGGKSIAELAGEAHVAIARPPWRLFVQSKADRCVAPLPYRIVARSFAGLSTLAAALPSERPSDVESPGWRKFASALNGVLGDSLAALGNDLAIPMTLLGRDGRVRDAPSPAGLVVFVHGLCGSELHWHGPAHVAFVDAIEAAGWDVAWLRYNTGLPIHENGRALANRLAATTGPLVLIGHSMGGLVIRSACRSAATQQLEWLSRLTHAAYLGTPHHGAPLERLGDTFNHLLGISSYSAPFMRLGNVRSRGIRDLGDGVIAAEACETGEPLPPHVHHLLVAGCKHSRDGERSTGDGLVPVASALGEHARPARCLAGPHVLRVCIDAIDHIALLTDPRIYQQLAQWLAIELAPTSPG
jgi:hypothetical protein